MDPNDANLRSAATTVVPSQNPSNTNVDKEHQVTTERRSLSSTSESDNEKKDTTAQQVQPKSSSEVVGDEKGSQITPGPTDDDDEIVYPSGIKFAVITLALCLAVFLVALDNTIIATAIPKITDRFNALGDIGWYGSAYVPSQPMSLSELTREPDIY